MENSLLRTAVGTAALVAFLSLPSVAAAETVVPPGNSAATQYTETFPTSGGNAEVNGSIRGGGRNGGGGSGRSPEKVLGSHTAHALEAQGEEGRTIAALATEAAPATAGEGNGGSGGGKAASRNGGGVGRSGSAAGAGQTDSGSSLDDANAGSSGFSEVLGHATGSSDGEMGLALPLILLLAPICALLFAWRRRERDQAVS
jgi:hypothetical protein